VKNVAMLPDGMSLRSLHLDAARREKFTALRWDLRSGERRDLPVNGAHTLDGGTTPGHKWELFTADSDSSLTGWVFPNGSLRIQLADAFWIVQG
jgi:hypothetical protein